MLDYPALAALAAVISEGSFERAAQSLGITPSAVSQRVRGFEERLGAVLVIRGQPCTPTARGRALCAHFDRVQLLEADLGGDGMDEGMAPTLKIAVNADSLATWFPAALTAFARDTGLLLELTLEDEAYSAERLRSGEVLAAVTSNPEPVQGCRTIPLGALRYAACASPAYVARHFGAGVSAQTLDTAPCLRFNRQDALQAQWAMAAHSVVLAAPTHWIPSTQAFIDLGLLGIAWGVQPVALAQPHLDAGRLVELPPAMPLDVNLYWTVSRLHARSLGLLTDSVRRAAQMSLRR